MFLKVWTKQQQVVSLSTAEGELQSRVRRTGDTVRGK